MRPRDDSSEVMHETVSHVLVALSDWLGWNSQDGEQAKIEQDLSMALSSKHNGYEIAKFLDTSCGWKDIDADLVGLLQGATETHRCVHRRHVRSWVKKSALVPKRKLGETVLDGANELLVVEINLEDGMYTLKRRDERERIRSFGDERPFEEIDALFPIQSEGAK